MSWDPKGELQIMIRPESQISTPKDLAKAVEISIDDYEDIKPTQEQETRIKKRLVNYRTGATAAIPLTCTGDKCPFRDRCPFYIEGLAPLGRACLVEINLVNGWRTQYIEEYKISPSSFTELSMISELVEIELLLYRINTNLAMPKNASLTINQTVGVSPDGIPLTRQEVSPLFEARDRLNTRKTKLIKLMVGDRQEKYKEQSALKKSNADDPSQQSAELRKQVELIIEKAKKVKSQIQKTEAIEVTIEPSKPGEQPAEPNPSLLEKEEESRELQPEDILGIIGGD